jgi:hypothetical protein
METLGSEEDGVTSLIFAFQLPFSLVVKTPKNMSRRHLPKTQTCCKTGPPLLAIYGINGVLVGETFLFHI